MGGFVDPFQIGLVPKKLTDEELARALRVDLAAELEAINLYEAHIAATDNEQAKEIIDHILQEEREHFSEFLELVKQLDPRQVEAEADAKAQHPAVAVGPTAGSGAEAKQGTGFTVGSLIGSEEAIS